MTSKKDKNDKLCIAVTGATGAQGRGLVDAILRDGTFAVRALTRDPESGKARELRDLGADVVAADVDDAASIRDAFEGMYGAYCVTFFWDHLSPEREIENARTMAQAARDARVRHVIWSTLEDTRKFVPLDDDRMPTLMGKYKVPHFDAKGEANAVFRDLDVPTTFLLTSFYWENLIHFGMGPQKGADGKLEINLPMGKAKLPGIAACDIGKCAFGIFQKGATTLGETIGIAGEHLTGAEMAAALSLALGVKIRHNAVSPEVYRTFAFPGAEDLGNMFQFNHDFSAVFCKTRSVTKTRELNPELLNFDAWLAANKALIPMP